MKPDTLLKYLVCLMDITREVHASRPDPLTSHNIYYVSGTATLRL